MTTDYKTTVFLPQTQFPMKAGLAAQEPGWLARWEKLDLYKRLREQGIRDERDETRACAPMRPADDAVIIDSSTLSAEDVLARMESIVRRTDGSTPPTAV